MARLFPLILSLLLVQSHASTDGKSGFVSLVASLCQKTCGIDPRQDQVERQWILDWMKAQEGFTEEERNRTAQELCEWIKTDRQKSKPVLTKEKRDFLMARFSEKKSPWKKIFCD